MRNYDGLGGQLLFAWLHQHHVLHWTDNRSSPSTGTRCPDVVLELGDAIEDLYWRSHRPARRPRTGSPPTSWSRPPSTPHPASTWARGPATLPLDGPPKGLTDAVLDDEFPLSMFYEALRQEADAA